MPEKYRKRPQRKERSALDLKDDDNVRSCVVIAPAAIAFETWIVAARPNWWLVVTVVDVEGRMCDRYAQTNVPACVPLAVPLAGTERIVALSCRVTHGTKTSSRIPTVVPIDGVMPRATERDRKWGTGQRPTETDWRLTAATAQTSSPAGTDPTDFTPKREVKRA